MGWVRSADNIPRATSRQTTASAAARPLGQDRHETFERRIAQQLGVRHRLFGQLNVHRRASQRQELLGDLKSRASDRALGRDAEFGPLPVSPLARGDEPWPQARPARPQITAVFDFDKIEAARSTIAPENRAYIAGPGHRA